jgi:hypothetical protein
MASREARCVIYVLEFFHLPQGGEPHTALAIEKRRIKTHDQAVSYARGAIDNVVFDGKRADGCLIKDQMGSLISEVKREARRP